MRRGGLAMAKAVAKAKAKAVPGRRMRRPARVGRDPGAGHDPLTAWDREEIVKVEDITLEQALRTPVLVIEEGSYFMGECRLTGKPLVLRVHWCPPGCGGAETAADLVHARKVRWCQDETKGEGWYSNLAKVTPHQDDELAELRKRYGEAEPLEDVKRKEDRKDDKNDKKEKKKDRTEKEKDGKEKDKKSKQKKRDRDSGESLESEDFKGKRPKSAATKSLSALYRGTGLDPREKVRATVARSAKRSVKKKEKKKDSSGSSSGKSSDTDDSGEMNVSFYLQASRAKSIAESHPGALCHQTLLHMKQCLLQEAGLSSQTKGVDPVALQYYRTVILKKGEGTGPMHRELFTLSACVDALLKGRPCHALDIATQRMKSVESTLGGVHWSISQRLEYQILGVDSPGLAATQEVREAQRDAHSEHKTKLLASAGDGRGPGKGGEKGKAKNYGGKDGGKKGGKTGSKADAGKKKDGSPTTGYEGGQEPASHSEMVMQSFAVDGMGAKPKKVIHGTVPFQDATGGGVAAATDADASPMADIKMMAPTGHPRGEKVLRLRVKNIDYKGDEVQIARYFTWDNVGPALPAQVGSVPLVEVCSLGCQYYVTHFEEYLKPPSEWPPLTWPKVMVEDRDWGPVCGKGLVESGVCEFIREDDVFTTGRGKLLNGMFGVTKDEYTSVGTEIFRLIMNLIPLNGMCYPISGDVDALPAWSSMNPYFLQPHENLLISSEDVKRFFYTMFLPPSWTKFLAFNKPVPEQYKPSDMVGEVVYIAAKVLPMGFLNSVSLAQHVHRNLVSWGRGMDHGNPPEDELRKDQAFSVGPSNWRIYLDNYDLLEKVEATQMVETQQSCPGGVLSLREAYEHWQVPRNLKKSVTRSSKTEVQGATVDGVLGIAFPREQKLAKYFGLALTLLHAERASQKQWQVVCGGLVYVAMFRRPLLGCLNAVWRHIVSFDLGGPRFKVTPVECKLEVCRFLGLFPLARLDFRLDVSSMVTCSDASSTGGGICASSGLTPVGSLVADGALRGQVPEPGLERAVLSIGLFDGISALRVALDVLELTVIGHVSVECQPAAQKVVQSHFPTSVAVDTVQEVDEAMVRNWAQKFGQCSLVLLGSGPPCQGVSGLNSDRRGALRDERSSLFVHVPRIKALLQKCFPWAAVHSLMESVASMDDGDRSTMSEGIGCEPVFCDAGEFTWCSRPRLYWLTWDVIEGEGVSLGQHRSGVQSVHFSGNQPLDQVIKVGWHKVDLSRPFPTFTTSRPRQQAGRKPAGVHQCTLEELQAWYDDWYRFPPYQYKHSNCLTNSAGEFRVPEVRERELMLGFPLDYTIVCGTKQERKNNMNLDDRLTLLGNSWSVPVVACLLVPLFSLLGFCSWISPQQILGRMFTAGCRMIQGRLTRLPLNPLRSATSSSAHDLAFKLCNLVSVKGEDILLTAQSDRMTSFQRLRASVPSKLWKWKTVTGWRWTLGSEHINSLELRAILTSIRWRLEHQRQVNTRMVHLTDSMVCLHVLSRGRSSSRKLRRTVSRVNALTLVGNLQPVWAYVHTNSNLADRPSRWGRRVKSKFRNAKA
eukprot:Skav225232  [mRNA]  locus=scaffold2946:159013:164268:+ [translate_table: standard]